MKDETLYHIYAKSECLYPCLKEKEFKIKWAELNAMVGLMHTNYQVEEIKSMRASQRGYGAIAKSLGMSKSTVARFCVSSGI